MMSARYVALDPFIDAQVIQAISRLGIGCVSGRETCLRSLLLYDGRYGLKLLGDLLCTAIAVGEIGDALSSVDVSLFQVDGLEPKAFDQAVECLMIAINEFAAQLGHYLFPPCCRIGMHATTNVV